MNNVLSNIIAMPVIECDVPNHKGRIYTKEIVEKRILNDPLIKELINTQRFLGMFEPNDKQQLLNPIQASHCITKLYFDEDKLVADLDILNTPVGRIVNDHLLHNDILYLALRGDGTVKATTDGKMLVTDDYVLNDIPLYLGKKKD